MPVKEIRGESELDSSLLTKATLGYVIVYFFEEGSNTNMVLSPVYEEISRRCPFSHFFKASVENLDPDVLEKHGIISYPNFMVISNGSVKQRIQVSTKEGLISQMKQSGVLNKQESLS